MKTAGFRGVLTSNGQIAVPREIASQVPPGEPIRVLLQWDLSMDEAAWRAAGRREFEPAYPEHDSIYELLIQDTSTR
jgi:hypothetical protein